MTGFGATENGGQDQNFTLIELLIVVSIIALLASMLLPILGRAREQARHTACVSNLRQINLGVAMYVDDFSGWYPANRVNSGIAGNWGQWANLTSMYIDDREMFQCDVRLREGHRGFWALGDGPEEWKQGFRTAFGTNHKLGGGGKWYRDASIKYPEGWAYLGHESLSGPEGDWVIWGHSYAASTNWSADFKTYPHFYRGAPGPALGSNPLVFFDLHVESLTFNDVQANSLRVLRGR